MKLGSLVVDSARPGLVGVFNGYAMRDKVRYAKVKFGKSLIVAPEWRISLKTKTAGVPNRKTPTPQLKGLSPEKYAVLLNEHGIDRDELHRRALAVGLDLDEAFDAFVR